MRLAAAFLAAASLAGAAWKPLLPTNVPRGRSGAGALWVDGDEPELAVFGGALGTCPTSPTTNALLVLGNGTWATSSEGAGPSPRVYAEMVPAFPVFGASANATRALVFGGNTDAGPSGEAWLACVSGCGASGSGWEPAKQQAAGDGLPGARAGHTLVAVPAGASVGWSPAPVSGGVAFLFGGFNGTQVLADSWLVETSAARWHLLSAGGPPGGAPAQPGVRAHHSSAVLPGGPSPVALVFGGIGGPDPAAPSEVLGDLWAFSLARRAWTNLTVSVAADPSAGAPAPRQGAALRVASTRPDGSATLLLLGGADASSNTLDDAWLLHVPASLSGARWEAVAACASAPSPRAYASAATMWSQATGLAEGVVVYGGVEVIPDNQRRDAFVFRP